MTTVTYAIVEGKGTCEVLVPSSVSFTRYGTKETPQFCITLQRKRKKVSIHLTGRHLSDLLASLKRTLSEDSQC